MNIHTFVNCVHTIVKAHFAYSIANTVTYKHTCLGVAPHLKLAESCILDIEV